MNWNSIEHLPDDYIDVIFTDGKDWWKGHVGEYYDYDADKRVHPVWISSDGNYIEGVTFWAEVGELPY